jgi:lysophospholipase L1-like esterase
MRRLLLLVAGLLGALCLVEGLVRLRQWRRYGTTSTTYYRFATDPTSGLRIPEPGYAIGPIRINSLGFRGAEIEQPKPPGRIRVAFLGASTTFCVEVSALETTWPHLVVEGLRTAAPDLDFDYVNGGVGGFTAAESLVNLERRVAPFQPDVIVYYEATNDLTADTRRLAMQAGLYEPEEDAPAPIGDWWLTYFLIEKNLVQFRRSREKSAQLVFEPRVLARDFEERLTRLVQAAQSRAPVVVLATFAVQMRREQTPELQRAAAASALYYMPFLDPASLLDGYAEYNRVIRTVADTTGVILIEGEADIPGDPEHFADSVHFRDPGSRLQAERILRGLLAAPAFQELLGRRRAEAGG